MFFNRYLLKFIRGFYGKAGFISLIHLIDTLLGTVIMMCSAVFTHMLLYKKSVLIFSHINQVFILIGICLVLKFILAAPKTKISEKLGAGIKDNIRASVMQKLFAAGPAYMNKKRTGDMTSMVTFRVDAVKNYYTAFMLYVPAGLGKRSNGLDCCAGNDFLPRAVCTGYEKARPRRMEAA